MGPVVFVDQEALIGNYKLLCAKANRATVGAVVKADAYGLGMLDVAQALHAAGCRTFFTAYFEEALRLRAHFSDVAIIALHGVEKGAYKEAYVRAITPMVNYLEAVEAWHAFAKQQNRSMPVCIHLDTGMNRLGLSPKEQTRLIERQELLDGLDIKAWASHFARADEFDNQMTPAQRNALVEILRFLPKAPISLCNSSGVFWGDAYHFDLIRPGIALYGGNPTPHRPNPMCNVVELQAPIIQVRDVEKAMTVGYGAMHSVERRGRIATLALGYADGYARSLSNKGEAMIEGFSAPIVGRISMDLITLDVTGVPESALSLGAMATIIGDHRPIDQVALEAGTIPYEIITSLGTRVERQHRALALAA